MGVSAVIMMIAALVLVWGGLVAAVVHLSHHPEEVEAYDVDDDGRPDNPSST